MNILQVTEFFAPRTGGSTEVAYQTARHLARRGHRVTVCTSDFGREDPPYADVAFEVLRFRSLPSRWKFYVTPGLIPWVRKHLAQYDVVHMHNVRTFQNAVVAQTARRREIPYLISAHGSLPFLIGNHAVKHAYDMWFGRRLLADAQRLVAVSEAEIDHYLERGVPRGKIVLILNGLDLEEFAQLPAAGTFRHRLAIAPAERIVLFLGRLHKRKRVDHLLRAFAHLCSGTLEAKLVVAGPDEGELSTLQDLAHRLQMEGDVVFAGPLYGEDKLAAYVDADVLANPATQEIFGLVPFEAILCGTPVVASNDSGAGQLIRESGAGYTVPPGDVDALAEGLSRVLANPAEAREKVAAGQAFVRRELDWAAIASRLEELYARVGVPSG